MAIEKQNNKSSFSLLEIAKPQLVEIKISVKSKANTGIMKGQTRLVLRKDGKIAYSE
jgi:hypothetical protein